MKKIVLTFGLLSGGVSAAMMFATLPFLDRIGFDHGAVIGYTAIVASFLFVFFGVRAYRQELAGGTLTFGRAFTVGILITLISCLCYVAAWEVIYYRLSPGFMDKYTAYVVDAARASGASAHEIEAKRREMADFKQMYDRPVVNAALTFLEPFPIGLLVTLITAFVLRTRNRAY